MSNWPITVVHIDKVTDINLELMEFDLREFG